MLLSGARIASMVSACSKISLYCLLYLLDMYEIGFSAPGVYMSIELTPMFQTLPSLSTMFLRVVVLSNCVTSE